MEHDEIVTRGDIEKRSFSIIYLKQGHVVALDCVNATKDYVQGKALVMESVRVKSDALQNIDVPLKTHTAAASGPQAP